MTMDTQLEFFSEGREARRADSVAWRQLAEAARATVRDLLANLAVKHLQSKVGRNERNEHQRKN
jgi:hypothetical protein